MMDRMQSCVDYVYDAIVRKISDGDLKQGDLINRRALALELKTSVSPVGDAMLQLELEGILETIPRKGTRVRSPNQEDVWGLLMTRLALECQVARMVCGEIVRGSFDSLRELAREVDESPKYGSALLRSEESFHRALFELAECPALLSAFDTLARQSILLIDLRRLAAPRRMSHLELVESLATDDPDSAERAMRAHIQHGKAAFSLERGFFKESRSLRFGRSPLLARRRLGDSLSRLLSTES